MIEIVHCCIIPAAYAVLPAKMKSPQATAMMLATGNQESKFLSRQQLPRFPNGPPGPALGLWQFEKNGIRGVMQHVATRTPLNEALRRLRYAHLIGETEQLHQLVRDNDIVAAVFARLNLWWLRSPLPAKHETREGWLQYLAAWNPGEPHELTWPAHFADAWNRVEETTT